MVSSGQDHHTDLSCTILQGKGPALHGKGPNLQGSIGFVLPQHTSTDRSTHTHTYVHESLLLRSPPFVWLSSITDHPETVWHACMLYCSASVLVVIAQVLHGNGALCKL